MSTNYKIIRNAISKDTADLLSVIYSMIKDISYYKGNHQLTNLNAFIDAQCANSFPFGRMSSADGVLKYLQPKIENAFGKSLLPVNAYGRIYWNGSELKKHIDSKRCEYSATLCIEADDVAWPIFIDDVPVYLAVGDLVCYKGEIPHWREPFTGTQQIQLFLHYVDANGPYKDMVYDGRPMLGIHTL